MKITGTARPSNSSTSKPSSFGIWTSRNIRSGASSVTAFTASKPLPHSATIVTAGVRAEVFAHDAAGQGLIVHDDDAQGIRLAHFASVDTGRDNSMRQTPSRSVLLTTASPP